jgi:hypothetical protein
MNHKLKAKDQVRCQTLMSRTSLAAAYETTFSLGNSGVEPEQFPCQRTIKGVVIYFRVYYLSIGIHARSKAYHPNTNQLNSKPETAFRQKVISKQEREACPRQKGLKRVQQQYVFKVRLERARKQSSFT